MKRTVLLLVVIALASCSTAYQQIANISSPQMKIRDDGKFCYNEEDIVVDYNFWAENGRVSFVITNNSDKDIYVDLSRSFLVVNGMTFDYFKNRTFSTNASSTVISSSAYSGLNTYATANGMADAFSSYYGGMGISTALATASGYSRTNGYSHRSSASNTIDVGVEYSEKSGVWIPAHSARSFCEFSLLGAPYRQCGLARNPSKREDATLTFTQNSTPLAFDNLLMLVVDGVDHRLTNSFYIERVTNLLYDQTYNDEIGEDCYGNKTEKNRIFKFKSANRFYINYRMDSSSTNDRINKRKKRN